MKTKLIVGFLLLSLICWAYPLPVSGYTAEEETKVEVINEPVNVSSDREHNVSPITPHSDNSKMGTRKPVPPATAGVYDGRHYSKDEVIQLIKDYSAQYGIDEEAPLCIARHESGYNQFSKNKSSSASGVFQYLSSTWLGSDEHKAGLSVWDADANVRAAIKYMASRKNAKPWVVAGSCPSVSSLN